MVRRCALRGAFLMCWYRLRFVLNDIRSLFHQVVLKCVLMFKSNSLVNPKDL